MCVEQRLTRAVEAVKGQFGEIDSRAGAVLISSLVQVQAYIERTEALQTGLGALEAALSEVSLVLDESFKVEA